MDENNLQEFSPEPAGPLLDLDIRLTEEEVIACLKKTVRRAENKPVVQTVVLAIVFIYCVVGYIFNEDRTFSSLGIALAALVILAAAWLVPPLHRRLTARQVVRGPGMRMKVYGDRLVFGEDDRTTVKPEECVPLFSENLLVLKIGTRAVGIPRRVTGEEGWAALKKVFDTASD